ncbi:MAG: ligase-associated DNA damage response endonuclease PdeM, partial [Alphaproteobacteria bacterium]|nr:ligase-associated DNA damage response endonuclease PdeM [Alphaproteobacteria bacterium]
MHARITIEETALFADPAGALFWPATKTLIVADLHLEKGSSFAAKGVPLPPYDTRATLDALQRLIRRYTPERVVCLGDSFHDKDAGKRIAPADRDHLARMMKGLDWVWVLGNHDPQIPPDLGGRVVPEIAEGKLIFRHEPAGP